MFPKARTLPIRVDEVIGLRAARGWSAADLASRAGCSEKTISNVENGKRIYLATAAKIANALKVDVASLIDGQAPEGTSSGEAKKGKRIKISVIIDIESLDVFDESSQLTDFISSLSRIVAAQSDLEVLSVRNHNSIAVDLELDEKDAERLLDVFAEGKLDELRVTGLRIPPDPELKGRIQSRIPKPVNGFQLTWMLTRLAAAVMVDALLRLMSFTIGMTKDTDTRLIAIVELLRILRRMQPAPFRSEEQPDSSILLTRTISADVPNDSDTSI